MTDAREKIKRDIGIKNYNMFIKFLRENGCEYEYFDNITHFSRNFPKIIESLIERAFMWGSTKQGDIYWRNLDTKWRSYLRISITDVTPVDLEKEVEEKVNTDSTFTLKKKKKFSFNENN